MMRSYYYEGRRETYYKEKESSKKSEQTLKKCRAIINKSTDDLKVLLDEGKEEEVCIKRAGEYYYKLYKEAYKTIKNTDKEVVKCLIEKNQTDDFIMKVLNINEAILKEYKEGC